MSSPPLAADHPLALALERRRPYFNTLFTNARHQRRHLEADAFNHFLVHTVGPVAAWSQAFGQERVDAVVEALYLMGLEGVGTGLLGPECRLPEVMQGLEALLATRAPAILALPRRLIASFINALHLLTTTTSGRPKQWVELMRAACTAIHPAASTRAPHAELAERWLQSGQVAAWRAGMACYREGALDTAKRLKEPVLRAALGLGDGAQVSSQVLLERLAADPWLLPGEADQELLAPKELKIVRRVGDFVGFGGQLSRPPWLLSHEGRIYVTEQPPSSEAPKPAARAKQPQEEASAPPCWLLSADACGACLSTSAQPPTPLPANLAPLGAAAGITLSRNGEVRLGALKARLPELAEVQSSAGTLHTLAVSLPRSHRLLLVAAAP